jgi:hypothetical protein
MAIVGQHVPPIDAEQDLRDRVRAYLDGALEAGATIFEAIAAVESAAWSEAGALAELVPEAVA